MERGLVRFDLENLGTEIWLVSNPEQTQEVFEAPCPPEDSQLDAAARASRDCIVLRAHWGNDIPNEPTDSWLGEVLSTTRTSDKDEVRELVEGWWEQ